MPEFRVSIPVVHQPLDDGLCLSEALGFAEVSCLAESITAATKSMRGNLAELLDETPSNTWSQRWLPGSPQPLQVRLTLSPTTRTKAWQEPVEVTFPAVSWRQADDAWIAFVPALGIEVLSPREGELPQRVEEQVRTALMRLEATKSLRTLAFVQRAPEIQIEIIELSHEIKSPKRSAQDDEAGREQRESVLEQIAANLAKTNLPDIFERDAELQQLAELLSGRHPRSVLLIGPSGVGKTAILRGLARRAKGSTVIFSRSQHAASDAGFQDDREKKTPDPVLSFWETGGSRIVAGMTGFGMWQERCRHLLEEVAKRRAAHESVVLHVGPLLELMEVGQSEGNSQGIANFLRPAIGRGELLIVAECTPEQLAVFERRDPHLLHAFAQLRIDEPTVEQGRRILEQVARRLWIGSDPGPQPAALDTLDRLHRRYATYSAYPGRPLRFLKAMRQDHSLADGPVTASRVTAALARETGLPLWLLEDSQRFDLANATAWFAARVMGQPAAVSAVTDLLAVVKAGMHRERKPLASFLFIGPTGVGKTEMAKSLVEFLFGDPQRMVRVDMSEYADELAVQRLIGGTISDEGWLTSRVREQPFAVVLLDEFEKAHPAFFDLFLQVLSDGRLTDAAGRVADFRNCVVIMTSNLGAETFQKGSVGFAAGANETQADHNHFLKAVREFVRPELFNRIDAILPFGALDNATTRSIVERQLQLLRQRDGWRSRRLTLDIAPQVVEHLLLTGFDRRYGARSLKRVLERELLSPLSAKLNGYSADTALRGEIDVTADRLRVTIRAQVADSGRTVRSLEDDLHADASLPGIRDLRRRTSRLLNSSAVVELRNQLFKLTKLAERQRRKPVSSPEMLKRLSQRDEVLSLTTRIARHAELAIELEDTALLRLYSVSDLVVHAARVQPTADDLAAEGNPLHARHVYHKLEADFRELLFDVHERANDTSKQIRLAIYGEQRAWSRLLGAYLVAAQVMQAKVEVWRLAPPNTPRESPPPEHWNTQFVSWQLIEPIVARTPTSERPDVGVRATAPFWRLNYQRPETTAVPLLEAHPVRSPPTWLTAPDQGSLGVVISLTGLRTFARFVGESGLHQFIFPSERRRCVVETALSDWKAYLPPRGIDRKGGLDGYPTRREYDEVKSQIVDKDDLHPLTFGRTAFEAAVTALLETRHMRDAERLLT